MCLPHQAAPPTTMKVAPPQLVDAPVHPAPPPPSMADVDAGLAVPTPLPPEPEKSRPVAHDSGPGIVSFDATPWANISVDGQDLGATPVVRQTLSAGNHDVTFQFSNGAVLNKRVQVQANRVLSVVGDGATMEVQLKTLKK